MAAKMFSLGENPYSEEDAQWDAFVAAHPHGSLLQTTNWARLKNRFGWSSHRVWLKQEGAFAAGAQVLYRSAGAGRRQAGLYPPRPACRLAATTNKSPIMFNQIDESAYQHGAGIVKLEPLLWQKEMTAERWAAICARYDCVIPTDTIQPPRTIMIDLRADEEEILARDEVKDALQHSPRGPQRCDGARRDNRRHKHLSRVDADNGPA